MAGMMDGSVFMDLGTALLHIPSGMKLPLDSLGFRRQNVKRYDRVGYNISAGYERSLGPRGPARTSLTLYIYPQAVTGEDPRAVESSHFERVKSDIARVQPGAQLVLEREVALACAGYSVPGRMAAFSVPPREEPPRARAASEIYLFHRGIWSIKYRITYAGLEAPVDDTDVAAFIRALGFPRD